MLSSVPLLGRGRTNRGEGENGRGRQDNREVEGKGVMNR